MCVGTMTTSRIGEPQKKKMSVFLANCPDLTLDWTSSRTLTAKAACNFVTFHPFSKCPVLFCMAPSYFGLITSGFFTRAISF